MALRGTTCWEVGCLTPREDRKDRSQDSSQDSQGRVLEESWDRWLRPQPMDCPWEGSTGEQKEMSSSSLGLPFLGVWRPSPAHSDPGGTCSLIP